LLDYYFYVGLDSEGLCVLMPNRSLCHQQVRVGFDDV